MCTDRDGKLIVLVPTRCNAKPFAKFHRELDRGEAGDNMGALLRGVKRDQIKRGMVLAVPNSIKPVKKFLGSFYILSHAEGGRATPFMNNYRPQAFS